ncbi:double-strand break repair helicase AddA [Martelella sp. HB161492]|uniref:double-strand break repair helicase AddA n=1 Tax=Martelella sp. HB161492 TaxID=2720726 RepID=UPI00158FA16E|nr:double-strand break repair helicase AddA [Martelella sp. HB161492]
MANDASVPGLDAPAEDWLSWTTGQQRLASDPARTVWVSANAGSGKTHVLTQRVVRLLLAGARPSAILCLTYTKAAASEMSNRVFARLAEWAVMPDDRLAAVIEEIEGARPDGLKLAIARRLFARALETPGGLKIQTIHAFCEKLLHQFPLEANVAGHFAVLDDIAAATLLEDARRQLFSAAARGEDEALAAAFAHVLDTADDSGLERLLGEIVSARHALRPFFISARAAASGGKALRRSLGRQYGFGEDETAATIAASAWPLPDLDAAAIATLIEIARADGGKRSADLAKALSTIRACDDAATRLTLLQDALLTKTGAAKAESTLAFKSLRETAPDIAEALIASAAFIEQLSDRLNSFTIFEKTVSALVIAEKLDQRYEELKKRRGKLDFEDLIARAAALLTRADSSRWIHYKLDQGIDHILVDEAQDTAPLQWDVVRSLTEDFFAGEGARAQTRTMFAVGDEKQSIYSFQGARPERFAAEGRATQIRVRQSSADFSRIGLPLSFRSTSSVLSAVDQVFKTAENRRGLSAEDEAPVHISNRLGHPGLVEVWEKIAPAETDEDEDWTAPFDATPESAPPAVLARRIAARIAAMIGTETIIEGGHERTVRPGDILVLVRKRDGFVNALTRLMKTPYDIPVAGADRLKLADHIAVKDLMALGRFAILPEDDLSLAAILKSPLINLDEDDLFAIAARRTAGEHVWSALRRLSGEGEQRFVVAVERLERAIGLARRRAAFDFYADILAKEGGRRAFLARLGSEASDILDEFLNVAAAHEDNGLPGLQSFLDVLDQGGLEVKREQDKGRNEVRIMTVHASKGLEAPVVFVVDSGGKAFVPGHLSGFRMMEGGLPVWHGGKKGADARVLADLGHRESEAEEEYRRLLYVAMTRAADRLIVTGYRGKRDNDASWHAMIASALSADDKGRAETVTVTGPDGDYQTLLWREAVRPRTFDAATVTDGETNNMPELPARLLEPFRDAERPIPPLSPSRAGLEVEDPAPMTASPLFSAAKPGDGLERGRLAHRLLQLLPGLAEAERDAGCRRYLERAGHMLSPEARARLGDDVMALLSDERLAPVFGPDSRAEVSITGTVTLGRDAFAVSGRLDRLAIADDRVLIVDYKTNRNPPQDAASVPFSHAAQMAVYAEILKPLYPGKAVECLLVYSENRAVIALSPAMLDETLGVLSTK